MQAAPCVDVDASARTLETILSSLRTAVDIVLYPEGWNGFSSYSSGPHANFEANEAGTKLSNVSAANHLTLSFLS